MKATSLVLEESYMSKIVDSGAKWVNLRSPYICFHLHYTLLQKQKVKTSLLYSTPQYQVTKLLPAGVMSCFRQNTFFSSSLPFSSASQVSSLFSTALRLVLSLSSFSLSNSFVTLLYS